MHRDPVAVVVQEQLPCSVNPNRNRLVRGEKAACPWNAPHSPVQDFVCVTAGHGEAKISCPTCSGYRLCNPGIEEATLPLKMWVKQKEKETVADRHHKT